MKHYVYEIIVDGVRRYVGVTKNVNIREKQHRRDFKTGKKKMLYIKIKQSNSREWKFNTIKEFQFRDDAERFEALLILLDYFQDKKLWQKEPIGFKYF